MDYRKLLLNAALAGMWAGLAILSVPNQHLDRAAIVAALVAAVRAAIGYLASKTGRTVPVDR